MHRRGGVWRLTSSLPQIINYSLEELTSFRVLAVGEILLRRVGDLAGNEWKWGGWANGKDSGWARVMICSGHLIEPKTFTRLKIAMYRRASALSTREWWEESFNPKI